MHTATVATIAFWTFLTTVCVGGMLMPYLRHRETQRTIRALAQSGQTIDPATLSRLIEQTKGPEVDVRTPYQFGRKLILPATILAALGPGMAMLGIAISLQAGMQIYPLYGVAGLLFCLGMGMGGYAFWLMRTNPPEGLDAGR
jgi:hypothetical protein